MERNRQKPKIGVHNSEIFALGKNPDTKERKRENLQIPSTSLGAASKKPKLASSAPKIETPPQPTTQEHWEEIAIDCDSVDLVNSVLTAMDQQDSDKILGLICGAIKTLTTAKAKSDHSLMLSLLYLAKVRPHIFCNDVITSALIAVLKKEASYTFKGKVNNNICVMATNLLARGYHDKKQWPESFLRLYIEDAINERTWVDNEECTFFIDNITFGFGTKTPPKMLFQQEFLAGVGGSMQKESSSNVISLLDDDVSVDSMTSHDSYKLYEENQSRYYYMQESFEKIVVESIKEQFNRRQPDLMTRNFLKFICTACGLGEVRAIVMPRLEFWIHNAKLFKPAHELLIYICYNITGRAKDHEVLAQLVKIRLKNKPSINVFMTSLKELINLQPSVLYLTLKFVVQNELSNARNPNNMGILATIFQTKAEPAANHLAEIYQEFLLQKDDCLKTLRVFLRELVKTLRYDINLVTFCKALMADRAEFKQQVQSVDYKERICFSIADLVCLCRFLSVSPQIREANTSASLKGERDQKVTNTVYNFYSQMAQIQCDSLLWMFEVVPKVYGLNNIEYSALLHKILLMEMPENYSKGDQWPPETERVLLLRLVSEVPLKEESIFRIIFIGMTKEIPFSIPDTVEIIDQMVRRAGSLKYSEFQPLEVNKIDVIDFLFSMAEYHHPENIILPDGYEPPKLAISSLYWKIWIILLILSAHNPGTLGTFCWTQYPLLKLLMEMCITNQFLLPAKMSEEELQLVQLEKAQIIEFETHLAAATSKVIINEHNSLLLSQVMLMEPMGIARRPPKAVLDQLVNLNHSHRLGHLLCKCRKPDLLLDIIQRQGTTQSMPWLADLVQSSNGEFNHLPVQCLCEFLLSNINVSLDNARDNELISYIQKLLCDDRNDYQASCEVLEYFLRRLSSTTKCARQSAIRSLKLLLKVFHVEGEEETETMSDWLLKYLPAVPSFLYVRQIIIVQLRSACQVENDPELIMIYIQFIATNTLSDPVTDMLEHIMDMSLLVVERTSIFASITPSSLEDPLYESKLQTLNCLFVMFNNFIIKMKDEKSPTITLPEFPGLLLVNFADGTHCHMHLNILHALIILLINSFELPVAQTLLDFLFPIDGTIPQAFGIENYEPVQIFPDWLKLRMIRSNVDRLVDIALLDLTPEQIVLFVQNFGTPVNSMSKLLALLDRSVVEDFESVNAVLINKNYLVQFIEIQRMRGAKNGHISIKALKSSSVETPKPKEASNHMFEYLPKEKLMNPTKKDVASKNKKPKKQQKSLVIPTVKPRKPLHGHRNVGDILTELMSTENIYELEKKGKKWLHENVNENKLSLIIDSISGTLSNGSISDKNGLLVDWLVESDSELVNACEVIQLILLFGKAPQSFRPLLLSLLIHQVNWGTIDKTLKILLKNENVNMYDPTSVLDFVAALVKNTKFWQGRDKSVAKHEQPEIILLLEENQIKSLTDYILLEGKKYNAEELILKLAPRTILLLQLLETNSLDIKSIVEHVISKTEKHLQDSKIILLRQLYINVPAIKFIKPDIKNVYEVCLKNYTDCKFDQFSHSSLTMIASMTNGKDWQTMGQEIELIVRKMAASHPSLLLREIAVLAALLQGKSHMDLHVLRSEHHFSLFHQVLGVLEILQPQIFDNAYKLSLHNALESYFALLRHHFNTNSKEIYSIMCRLMDFLQAYATANVNSAFQVIEPQAELFQVLAAHNKGITTIQQLMQGLSLLKHKSEGSEEGVQGAKAIILTPSVKSDSYLQQWSSLCNHLKKQSDDISNTLSDIEVITYKKPSLLADIFDKLLELIFHSSAFVRNAAHMLLLRYLKFNPGNVLINNSCLKAYLQCLSSDDINISSSVLEFMPEIVLSLQEYSQEFLKKMFVLGITSKINTFPYLKRCITNMSYEHSC